MCLCFKPRVLYPQINQDIEMLSHLRGRRLSVTGGTKAVPVLAARQGRTTHVVFWNFPSPGADGRTNEMILRFPSNQSGHFRLLRLNARSNRLDTVRTGTATELETHPLRIQLAPYGVAWAQLGR